MTSTLCAFMMVAQAALGFGGHHSRSAGSCGTCGVEQGFVLAQIQTLQTCPRWRARDNAAHALRKVDWRCHPVVPAVLVTAMLTDREEEVREEAAESLAKMAPCLPEVHMALRRAADCDPDHATRKWARRGLKALGKRCEGACLVCGPGPVPVVEPPLAAPFGPVPAVIDPPAPSVLLAPESVPVPASPPSNLPEPMPGASPFNPAPEVSPPPLPVPPSSEPPLDMPLTQRRRRIRPLSLLRELRPEPPVSRVSDRD